MQWPYKDLEQQASGMGMNKLLVLTRKTIATQIIIACSNSASSMPACVKITSRESNRALLCSALHAAQSMAGLLSCAQIAG